MVKVYIAKQNAPVHLPYSLVFWPNFRFEISPKRLFLREIMEQYTKPFFTVALRAEEADFFAVPFEYFFMQKECPAYLARVFASAKAAGKKVLLFDYTDYVDWTPALPSHAILFRVSAYRHHKRRNEIIIPYFVEDMGRRFSISLKEKSAEPVVGYCGQSQFAGLGRQVRAVVKWFLSYALLLTRFDQIPSVHKRGIFWRRQALSLLQQSGLSCHFITRRFYSLHQRSGTFDPEDVRREYIENLRECDVALCVRGDANASQRLYEAMSASRIPLFVDTDCALPLEESIDYDSVMLRVPAREIQTLPARVRAWWEKETAESFLARERRAWEVYEKYLRLDRFFARVFDREQSPYRQLLFERESV